MRSLLLTLLLILAFTSTGYAQAPEVKYVIWEQGKPGCDEIYVEGVRIRYLTDEGVTVALYMLDVDGFYAAGVEVENKTAGRILVDPAQTRFVAIAKNLEQSFISPLPVEKVTGKVAGRAKWGNLFRTFLGALATRHSTSTSSVTGNIYGPDGGRLGTYDGSAKTTTSTPDYDAQRRIAERNARATADARSEADVLRAASLKTTTLFPDKRIDGFIFFPRKDVPNALFRMMIGRTVYEFRIRIK